ncbi:MAG: hypothetical protein F6J98_07655 [Moorea sp. SIO4G2]|nr:hypothetical protein [Moorena sp. SIO4G2]
MKKNTWIWRRGKGWCQLKDFHCQPCKARVGETTADREWGRPHRGRFLTKTSGVGCGVWGVGCGVWGIRKRCRGAPCSVRVAWPTASVPTNPKLCT